MDFPYEMEFAFQPLQQLKRAKFSMFSWLVNFAKTIILTH